MPPVDCTTYDPDFPSYFTDFKAFVDKIIMNDSFVAWARPMMEDDRKDFCEAIFQEQKDQTDECVSKFGTDMTYEMNAISEFLFKWDVEQDRGTDKTTVNLYMTFIDGLYDAAVAANQVTYTTLKTPDVTIAADFTGREAWCPATSASPRTSIPAYTPTLRNAFDQAAANEQE